MVGHRRWRKLAMIAAGGWLISSAVGTPAALVVSGSGVRGASAFLR